MKERYQALDGLRALACIGIVLMHIQANIDIKPDKCFLTQNIISFTGNLVLLFMMVSAFSLCCGYYNKFKNCEITPDIFYSKRYKRILPFFALLVLIDILKTFATEHFSITQAFAAELYEGFADLTLLFGLIPGNDITVVGVGWFLGVIFLFYLIFPFFTYMIGNKKRAWLWFLISIGLYFCVKCYFNPVKGVNFGNNSFMQCLPFFMTGGIIYLYRTKITNLFDQKGIKFVGGGIVILYTIYFFAYPQYRFSLSNLILYASWLIYAICEIKFDRKITLLNNKVVNFISNISMEIYLCHMMFFRISEKIHLENLINNNNLLYIATCMAVLIFAVLFSFAWKKYIEPKVLEIIG